MKRTLSTLAVFVTTLLLTLLTWHNSRLNADLHDQQRFERIGNIMADSIADRMRTYNHLLEQSRTFVSVTKELTPQIWREYVRGLQLPARYPDVQGIGFAKRLFRENLAAEEREIRKLPGFTDFAVWPPEPRPIYFPIVLLEPLDWRNRRALGFDMYSESKRRAAMDAAILSGEPRMSGIVVLAQETDQKRQPGFLIYTPVFASGAPTDTAEDKRSALIGFVYAPFRTHDLFAPQFDEISSFAETQFIDFEIFMTSNDGGHPQTHLLYDADKVLRSAKREPHSIRYRSISIPTAGQEFQLHVYALDGFQKHGGFWLPSTILAVGLAISSLLTRLVWLNTRQSERLEKSERQLRLITNALPALIAYIDPDSKIRFVNRIFETWFSDGQHPIIGQSAHAVMGAENFLMIEKALKKSLGGQPEKTECRLKTVKGQMLACDVHLIPDFGPQGRLKGVVALITDISKAKRREEQAQLLLNATSILHGSLESEHMVARFARALVPEFASSVVVDLLDDARVDHAGRIRRVSSVHQDPEKARILSEELDRFPSHADGADSREPVLIAHVDSEDLARISTNEERQKRLIQIGIASLICIPLVTREKIIGALHFGRGPHECPFDDDDFRFAIDIGNRTTLALENLRLFQDVHAANRAKEEFLATVSHELRTPMNVILGWLEILRDEKPDAEETDSILQTLERNARVQVELINDLLDISRIVSGKLALQTRPLNIAEAVSVAVDSVRPAARAKSLHLNLEVVDSPPNIRADADRLHQVLWNLLTNAVKFTPLGGRIDVRVTSAQDGVTITIADTGQGIERRFLPYVFDRFRQEQGGSNRQHGGLGIGLAIVRYLIELHGGSVHAASEGKGKGATFTIHLPTLDTRPMLSSQELSTVPHQNPPLLPSQESRTQHASTHLPKSVAWAPDARPLADLDILLVDDSADVRMLIERILARAGATVRSVSSATEALHLLKKGAFDCLISDIGLPEVDGYELIQRARTMEAARGHERMPAAALTAYAAEKDAQRALEAGYDVHIPKPVHGQDLIRTVASLTRGHQGPTPGVRVLQGV